MSSSGRSILVRYFKGRDLMYAGRIRAGLPAEFRRVLLPYFEELQTARCCFAWSSLRSTARGNEGETLVLEKNLFVEGVLPAAILRRLSEDEMAAYRAPFANAGEDRRPALTWPRQIPIEGEPPEMVRVATDCNQWLAESPIPKLFINAEPGAILTGRQREFCRTWRNQTEVTVEGIHFMQEDGPDKIGEAIAAFVRGLRVV